MIRRGLAKGTYHVVVFEVERPLPLCVRPLHHEMVMIEPTG